MGLRALGDLRLRRFLTGCALTAASVAAQPAAAVAQSPGKADEAAGEAGQKPVPDAGSDESDAAPAVLAPLSGGRKGRVPKVGFAAPDKGEPGRSAPSAGDSALAPPPPPAGAADTGVSRANRAYGAYQRGYYLTAMQIALPEAESGNAAAQTLVAEMFAQGVGVARSMDDAAFWYGQAAKNGDPSGEFNYALMLMHGQNVKKDEARAKVLMKKAADAGVAVAAFNHAQTLVADDPGKKGMAEALPYYETAADAGIADAQYALSQIYRNEPGISDAKRARARYWLTRAAEAGYDTAQLDLGIWLIDGVEGDKDYAAGFKWMKQAAIGGNVMAENRLARLYRNGIGTKQDRIAAAAWYIMAQRAGLQDNGLKDFFQGLTEDEQKQALRRANALQAQ